MNKCIRFHVCYVCMHTCLDLCMHAYVRAVFHVHMHARMHACMNSNGQCDGGIGDRDDNGDEVEHNIVQAWLVADTFV